MSITVQFEQFYNKVEKWTSDRVQDWEGPFSLVITEIMPGITRFGILGNAFRWKQYPSPKYCLPKFGLFEEVMQLLSMI